MGHHVTSRETPVMKFINLESRGGNYLVVASNIAWLRTAENGQTNVGMVGGQPLLVVGSIEEVAAMVLAGTADPGDISQDCDFPLEVVVETAPGVEPERPVAAAPVETPAHFPQAEPDPEPAPALARPQQVSVRSASMWERPASPPPKDIKMISPSQRMMGMLE